MPATVETSGKQVSGAPRRWLGRAMDVVDRRSQRFLVAMMLLVGLLLALPGLLVPAEPNSDGLFYEAQVVELHGSSQQDALAVTFSSDRARQVADIEDRPSGKVRVLDPAWVNYSAQFYQRRWLVPALALGVQQATGMDVATALQVVSMLGYGLLGVVLFLLLRRRFRPSVSVAVALGCMVFPPLYRWSFGQYVDSWGVLLECLALLGLVLVADRGLRWLPLWGLSMLALSLTRDATMILGICAIGLFLAQRRDPAARKRNLAVLAVGAAAAVPVLVLGGTPLRENFAYIFSGFEIPTQSDWGFVARNYLPTLWSWLESDVTLPAHYGVVGVAIYVMVVIGLAAVATLALRRARGDAMITIGHAALIGCVLFLLIANNGQGYRLELVFLPVIAIGAALLFTRLAESSQPTVSAGERSA